MRVTSVIAIIKVTTTYTLALCQLLISLILSSNLVRFSSISCMVFIMLFYQNSTKREVLTTSKIINNPKVQKSGLVFVGYRNKKIRTKGVKENTLHLSRVHKQPNRIYDSSGIYPTLSSQESSGRYFIYHNKIVRKLTLKECFRLMGFLDNFKEEKSFD